MRITTSMMYDMGISRLTEGQGALNRTQQQVSTGRRILTPADDPSGAASALQISQADGLISQHVENRNLARNGLGIEDGVLQSVSDLLSAMKTTVVAAGNGTLGNVERGFMASELRGQLDQLIGLANSTDGNGNYLFSGFQSFTMPFARSGSTVSYSGDTGSRALQVSGERQMAVGDSGQDLFMSIPEGNGRFVAAASPGNSGTGRISGGTLVDPSAITGDDYQITFSVAGPATTYTVTNVTTGTVLSSGNPYVEGSAIVVDGMQFGIQGSPANGDQFILEPSGRKSVFDVVNDMISALSTPVVTPADSAKLSNALTLAGNELENAIDKVLDTRASVGARLKELDALEETGSYMHLQNQTRLSELQDLDYNEALSRLAMQQITLEAAQKSFVQVAGLSLFKYL
jgi:flagellar hook-associated protein 3 FlgL